MYTQHLKSGDYYFDMKTNSDMKMNHIGHQSEYRDTQQVCIYIHNQIYYIYTVYNNIYIYIYYPMNRVHNLPIFDLSLSITL